MAKVAEGIARVAGGIATGRQRRSALAAEIKAQTAHRHNAVRSLLTSFRVARSQATRAQSAELRKVTGVRHLDVNSFLKGLKVSRRKSGVERSAELQESCKQAPWRSSRFVERAEGVEVQSQPRVSERGRSYNWGARKRGQGVIGPVLP